MTDFGFNVSTELAPKLRVGAQLFGRNIGRLGNWHPEVDWAFADYRVTDWLGFRGGKVKTTLGLYNDSQDMPFLHTWALMPQSVYPTDVRGDNIAHVGADIYGHLRIKKVGAFSYTLWGGKRLNDPEGGYLFGLSTSTRAMTLPCWNWNWRCGRLLCPCLPMRMEIFSAAGCCHKWISPAASTTTP